MTTPAHGRRVGPYRIERELARGGMGVVYVAVHEASGARVALKQLHPLQQGHEVRTRFVREAEAQARLRHPAIVRIHAAEFDEDAPYLAQDLLPGGSLAQRLAAGPLPLAEARAVMRRVGAALVHAHAQGILHRDLKPGNVLFDERGEACLTDFGLAGVTSATRRLTETGELMGTPTCMAPEQANDAKRADERADVYGLGAILYACLTGRAPFADRQGLAQTLRAVLNTPPTPPSALRPDVPPDLEAACLRALAKAPEARYPDVQAFLNALEPAAAQAPRWRARAALAACAAVGLGVLAALPKAPAPAPGPATTSPAEVAADPLTRALMHLEARRPLPAAVEAAALAHAPGAAGIAAAISRLAVLPKSDARDRLWATALGRADRLHELADWPGQLAPLPSALRALELQILELETFVADWNGSLNLDRPGLAAVARRVLQRAEELPAGVGGDLGRARTQRQLAGVVGLLSLSNWPLQSIGALFEPACDLLTRGPARDELELAYLYALAKAEGEPEQERLRAGLEAALARPRRGPVPEHWLAMGTSSLRNHPVTRWRPSPPAQARQRRAALERALRRGVDRAGWYRNDQVRIQQAVALDTLWEAWQATRAQPADLAATRAGAREALRLVTLSGNVHVAFQIRVVARLLAGESVGGAIAEQAARPESGRESIRGELALCREPPDLQAARKHFEAALEDARANRRAAPVEAYLGRLHVLVLLGELTAADALNHPDVAQADTEEAWGSAGGFYWHQPAFFAETLEGGWWPGQR